MKNKLIILILSFLFLNIFTNIYLCFPTGSIDPDNLVLIESNDVTHMFMNDTRNTGRSPYNASYNNGQLIWKYHHNLDFVSSAVMDNNRNIYISGSNFTSIYPNGTLNWQYKPDYFIWFFETPAVGNENTIYSTSVNISSGKPNQTFSNSSFYSFNQDGSINWEFIANATLLIQPSIDKNGNIYFGSMQEAIYCLYPNGSLKWRYDFDGIAASHSSIAIDDSGNVYLSTLDQSTSSSPLFCISSEGKLKWKYYDSFTQSTPTIGDDGTIYIVRGHTGLDAVYPNGTLKWRILTHFNPSGTVSIDHDDNIYVPGANGICVYDKHGSEKWYYRIGDELVTTPVIISNDDCLFFGTQYGKVYKMDLEGKVDWIYYTDGKIPGCPFIDDKGIIYVVSEDGYVYAIGPKIPTPPMSLSARFSDSKTILTWNYPRFDGGEEIRNYSIYRKHGLEEFKKIDQISSYYRSYEDSSLTNGIEYQYYVTATNIVNESNPSNIVNGIPIGLSSPPRNLSIESGLSVIRLNWSPPHNTGGVDLLSYRIYRSQNSVDYRMEYIVPVRYLDFTDEKIENGQDYWYYITAKNDMGESLRSNIVSSATYGTPSAPRITNISNDDSSVQIEWDYPEENGGSEIENFIIYKSDDNVEFAELDNISADFLTFTDQDISIGDIYYYSIQSYNGHYCSEIGDPVSCLVAIRPSPPLDLNIISMEKQIKLEWNEPISNGGLKIESIHIFRGESIDDIGPYKKLDGNAISFIDGSVICGKEYFYYLKAENEIGPSTKTAIEVGIAVDISSPPENLTGFQSNGTVELSWSPPLRIRGSLVEGYCVYRTIDGMTEKLEEVPVSVNYFSETNTNFGRETTYFVTAICDVIGTSKESFPSNEIDIIPATVPSTIDQLIVTPSKDFNKIQWKAPEDMGSDIIGYKISIIDRSVNDEMIIDLTVDKNSYEDFNVSKGTQYEYRIASYNSEGMSDYSEAILVTSVGIPDKVTEIKMKYENDQIIIEWDEPSNTGGTDDIYYSIYRSIDNESFKLVGSNIENTHEFIDKDITPGSLYYYRISSFNIYGSNDSDVVSIETNREDNQTIPFSIIIFILLLMIFIISAIIYYKKNFSKSLRSFKKDEIED